MIFHFIVSCETNDSILKVGNLTCNYLTNPPAIETPVPRFSWQLFSGLRNRHQSAYRILVADNEKDIKNFKGNVWDSGKTDSDQSILVDYNGSDLISSRKYFWKVKAWDQDGTGSKWSETGAFRMGLLSESDWEGARWIGFEELPDSVRLVPGVHGNGDHLGTKALRRPVIPLFRKEFTINKKVTSAHLYISGLGHYEATVNGAKAGSGFLMPGWTNYDKTVYYNTFDITSVLKKGANALGVIVGNGFYNINRERYRKLVIAWGMPKMICKLKISYTDGTEDAIVSDFTWRTSASAITYTGIFGGEDYDAQLEQPGWGLPGFDDTSWKIPVYPQIPGGRLSPETDYPVAVMEYFKPVRIFEPKPDTFLYDFGQNASGIIEIKINGKKGQSVKFTPSELITPEKLANQSASGRPYYYTYTLKGEGEETWRPRFTYYGFRYVQVTGAVPDSVDSSSDLPKIIDIRMLHTRNSSPETGQFSCSGELFNRTNELIRWAIKSNFQSVLTDCPHREKLGWLEQTYLMGESVHFNFDLYNLYSKQVNDMIESQLTDGLVPDIAPEYVPFVGGFRDSPEWGSASVILPWMIYKWYGDKSVMEKAWPLMTGYADYLESKSENHILSHGLGDWFDLGPDSPGPSQLTPLAVTATAIYYYDLALLKEMATILNKKEDRERFASRAAEVKKAFNERFYDPGTGVIATGSQTAMSMPWCVGLVDPENKEMVMQNLEDSIRLNGKALTAGDVGFHFLVDALTKGGKSQLLCEMNARDDVPGYGYQLKKGATALTESWPALENVSNNHLMLGHLMEWFYAGLGGISQNENSAAYREIVLKPWVVGDLNEVKTSYMSPYGQIRSNWQKQGSKLTFNVSVPVNTTALIYLPVRQESVVKENDREISSVNDIQYISDEKDRKIYKAGSGDYSFTVIN